MVAACAVGVAAGLVSGPPPGRDRWCPRRYVAREVRLEHQRLESDPRPGRSPVVVPNTWSEDMPVGAPVDRRYVVALACVRPLTTSERAGEPYTDGGMPGR